MRYRLIGPPIPCVGKTFWEIVSNLKNFGVGRLVLRHDMLEHPETSFLKIVKVVPLPPPRKEFEERRVLVYAEEISRGVKLPKLIEYKESTRFPKFQLIPKMEEEEYLSKTKICDPSVRTITVPKYREWPPLYKKLWEQENNKSKKHRDNKIPNLRTALKERFDCKIVLSEDLKPLPITSDLYRDVPVVEMIKEIVKLQKIVNARSEKE